MKCNKYFNGCLCKVCKEQEILITERMERKGLVV